jgi:hypothetical protein
MMGIFSRYTRNNLLQGMFNVVARVHGDSEDPMGLLTVVCKWECTYEIQTAKVSFGSNSPLDDGKLW